MTKPGLSEIVLVVDHSLSMKGLTAETIENMRRFVTEQKELPGEAHFSLVYFNHVVSFPIWRENLKNTVIPADYKAEGNTALLDALGETCIKLGEDLALLPEDERPSTVIINTISDGDENSSNKYTRRQLKGIMDRQRKEFSWNFIFSGADEDSILLAADLGMVTQSYVPNAAGLTSSYKGMSITTRNLRAGN